MKDRLTIGEFAKLKNITTETLRHYDRVGLLNPIEIDRNTGYRYYSILQYEKLSTILELRELGMSIEEIIKYFDNRNLKKSTELLKEKHNELKKRIKELKELQKSTEKKIEHLEFINSINNFETITLKYIEERDIITFNRLVKNTIEVNYSCFELEGQLKEIAPIVGENRYGIIIKNDVLEERIIFLFTKDDENINNEYLRKIEGGLFASMFFKGGLPKNIENIKKVLDYIDKNNYEVCGDIIEVIQIDISVTDKAEEEIFEIQIPIKKA